MENYLTGVKKVGFFGGTFDPIHNGHLNLAISLLEAHLLDQVFFTPANFSPTKSSTLPNSSKEERQKMVDLAIEDISPFAVCDLELKRDGPSYTIDTIHQLIAQHPKHQFYLILGEDMLENLTMWKDVETLLSLAPPLIGTRIQRDIHLPSPLKEAVEKGKTHVPLMEISSTALRERLKKKMYCGHLIPAKVLDFIKTKKLY